MGHFINELIEAERDALLNGTGFLKIILVNGRLQYERVEPSNVQLRIGEEIE